MNPGRTMMMILAIWIPLTAGAQTYTIEITPATIDQQEVGIAIQTTPNEREMNYQFTFSNKLHPVPTNIILSVIVQKAGSTIMDFGVRPVWEDGKAIMRFALREDFLEDARAHITYSRPNAASADGRYAVRFIAPLVKFKPGAVPTGGDETPFAVVDPPAE